MASSHERLPWKQLAVVVFQNCEEMEWQKRTMAFSKIFQNAVQPNRMQTLWNVDHLYKRNHFLTTPEWNPRVCVVSVLGWWLEKRHNLRRLNGGQYVKERPREALKVPDNCFFLIQHFSYVRLEVFAIELDRGRCLNNARDYTFKKKTKREGPKEKDCLAQQQIQTNFETYFILFFSRSALMDA